MKRDHPHTLPERSPYPLAGRSNSNFGDGAIGVGVAVGIGIDKTTGKSTPIPIPTPTPMTQERAETLSNNLFSAALFETRDRSSTVPRRHHGGTALGEWR